MGVSFRTILVGVAAAVLVNGCSGDDAQLGGGSTTIPTDVAPAWSEEEVSFDFGGASLYGVVTLPAGSGPFPAVVLISGSGGQTGVRAGTSTGTFVDHARGLAAEGFAVLRYDPPGVGRSTGSQGLPSLAERADETLAAVDFLSARADIVDDGVGLQGWSQGPWVMAMTAAAHPERVAFLVSVVGSGSSVAEQQIYGVEAQTRAAGHDDIDVAKAVLLGRLLVDWQLLDPIYEEVNTAALADVDNPRLGEFLGLVYADGEDPVGDLQIGIDILTSLRDEPWAAALYLEELYLPRFESIPADITAEQLGALKAISNENLTMDPSEFLTQIVVPVLAIFGEDDLNVDSARSAELFEQYLAAAGNDDVTIVVLPDVGHGVGRQTPGYWNAVSSWYGDHHPELLSSG